MAQPDRSSVHIDAILTNLSVAYIQDQSRFIAGKVFPIVPVNKQSDKYFKYTKDDWFRDEAAPRGDAAESVGSGYNLETDSYYCDVFAFHKDIGRRTRDNADNPLNMDRDATEFVTQRLLLRQERQFVTDYFGTSIWGTDITGVSASPSNGQTIQWDDADDSDPISDVQGGSTTVLQNTGFRPNTLVCGVQVFNALKDHPSIVDRIKYTSSDVASADIIARLLEVDRVLVAESIQNTAGEGATFTGAFNFGKQALLCYAAPNPSTLAPSAGYTFSWRGGVSGNAGFDIGIKNLPMNALDADRIEGETAFDMKVVGSDLGYFFTSIVS